MCYMLKPARLVSKQGMAETPAISSMRIQSTDFSATVFAGSVTACRQEVADPAVVMILFARRNLRLPIDGSISMCRLVTLLYAYHSLLSPQ